MKWEEILANTFNAKFDMIVFFFPAFFKDPLAVGFLLLKQIEKKKAENRIAIHNLRIYYTVYEITNIHRGRLFSFRLLSQCR